MSPSGGQGLNVAIRDTFTAANHLIPVLRQGGSVDAALFQRIQAERQPEIDALQAGQLRAGQMVMKPIAVLNAMFSMMDVAMKFIGKKMQAGHGIPPPEPKYLQPVSAARTPGG